LGLAIFFNHKENKVTIDLTKTNGSSPPMDQVFTPARNRIRAWFDGACEPTNPGGHATWGAIVEVNGKVVFSEAGYVGSGPMMSNNVAEYSGCIAVLREIRKHGGDVTVFGDSELVIKQLNGQYRAKRGLYLAYFHEAIAILESIGRERVKFEWIAGKNNIRADQLSRRALAARGIRLGKRNKYRR
jgi:ribonuclease HI